MNDHFNPFTQTQLLKFREAIFVFILMLNGGRSGSTSGSTLVYFYISPLGIFIKDTFSYIATQPLSSFPGASEIRVYRLFHEYVFICTFLPLFPKSI